ncbi:hypothetical protein AF335_29240 [Streptomyces eurocidicus]|uniref:Uncharacterized protein n=1 Tax=Streptomyces eurocidicus TaxID=66423 RepID=A0A2N8NNM3_STREU|nr:hypothetical protein AF335_29240 [Streptomyces eurocidicus]
MVCMTVFSPHVWNALPPSPSSLTWVKYTLRSLLMESSAPNASASACATSLSRSGLEFATIA